MELNGIIPAELVGTKARAVDGRSLFEWLGMDLSNFSRDVKRIIKDAGFIENVDYEVKPFVMKDEPLNSGIGGCARVDCFFTATAAKEICMMSNKEKGREVRKYFIQCEKVAVEAVANYAIPQIHSSETIIAQQRDKMFLDVLSQTPGLKEDAAFLHFGLDPKSAGFLKRSSDSEGTRSMKDCLKHFKIGMTVKETYALMAKEGFSEPKIAGHPGNQLTKKGEKYGRNHRVAKIDNEPRPVFECASARELFYEIGIYR